MTVPLQVTFRHIPPVPKSRIEALIEKKLAKLERVSDRILGVQVTVEMPHRHHNKGRMYHVRVAVELPGREIVASKQPLQNSDHVNLYTAVNDAFETARRELQAHVRPRRDHTSPRLQWAQGTI